ncbi:MAG: apolipoprotein N-acyltransferase [Gammaproteobacteria bacterium]|nr:apolipoprotein N-acyltransferase [Gammaproteobacteria bacterium]
MRPSMPEVAGSVFFGQARDRLTASRWWLALLSGGLQALALSPWVAGLHAALPAVLQTAAAAWLVCLLAGQTKVRAAALVAWLHASVWLVGATGWMFVSLHHFGGLPAWLSALAVALLCLALSGYMALAGAVWQRFRCGSPWRDATLFGGLWLLAELARALIFTGFPWGASGYALIDTPWALLAPWVGVYGLGCIWATLVALAALGAFGTPRHTKARWLMPLPLLGLSIGLAAWSPAPHTHPHGQPLKVALLQSNVAQDEKFDARMLGNMLVWHGQQLQQVQADLVVAPETAIPLLPEQLPEGYWDGLRAMFGSGQGRAALIGMPLGSLESGYTNSVVGLSPELAQPYRYDKHHLVPFGEFIPLGFRWFVNMMNMPLGDFSRGPLSAPSFVVKGQRVGPNICYEDLFGEELASRFVHAETAPTMLANVSNLAWFGDTVAIHQHLQIARMRSLEFQVPTIRSTNTGATVVIDHLGRVVQRMPGQTRGVLLAEVQGQAGVTPYAAWAGRAGLWPLVVLGLLVVVWRAWPALRCRP